MNGPIVLEMKADTSKAPVLWQNKPVCVHKPSSPSTLPPSDVQQRMSFVTFHLRKHREMSQPEKNENEREKEREKALIIKTPAVTVYSGNHQGGV